MMNQPNYKKENQELRATLQVVLVMLRGLRQDVIDLSNVTNDIQHRIALEFVQMRIDRVNACLREI